MAKKIAVLIFLIGFLSLIRTISLLWSSNLPDFGHIYQSSSVLLKHLNPYKNLSLFTQIYYPPVAILMFSPFLLFSFSVASKIFIIISVLCLLFSVIFLNLIKSVNTYLILVIIAATILSFPFKFTLGMGQINLILLFLLSLFLYLINSKKIVLSSFILTISICLKLFPIIFFVLLFIKRLWLILFLSIIFTFVLFAVPIIFVNFDTYLYYLRSVIVPVFLDTGGGVYYNQSITGLFFRLNIPEILTTSVSLSILSFSIYIIIIKKLDIINIFSLLTVVVLLINSYTWQHHMILLLIPYYFLLAATKSRLTLVLVFISYLLVALNIQNPQVFTKAWYGPIYLSHGFFGMVILWLLYLIRLIGKKG